MKESNFSVPEIPGVTVEQAAKGIRLYCETVSKDPISMMMLNIRMQEIKENEKFHNRITYCIKIYLVFSVILLLFILQLCVL
jgi:hypothetical protein